MISQAIINLAVVGITCIILLMYLIRFVLRYKHEYESNPLCTATVIFCLFIVLLATFVLPIDIFLVSFVKNPDGTFKEWATNETRATIDKTVYATYYTLYGITTFLIFIVIPFLHFFNEDPDSPGNGDRLHNAIKYTFGFAFLMSTLFTVGAFVHVKNPDPSYIINKIIHITESTKFQDALGMVLAIITMAGFLNVSFYTASGIFSWPIGLLLGTSSVAKRSDIVNDRETILRMRINNLKEKSRVRRLTPAEREQLIEAENDLREVEREEIALTGYRQTWTYRLRRAIRPAQVIVGLLFGILSLLLIVTLILVNTDRILHGSSPREGYILLKPYIFNPLEYVCVKLQDLIFVGPMPLLVVTCFLTVATISGIRNLGLWFLFARLHRMKIGRTRPQALLFFCMTIMLTALAFNMILYSMIAGYVTFGNQNYVEHSANGTTIKPCTLENYNQSCILTRTSTLLMQMMSQVWIFGAIFYWWSWTFVVVGTMSLIAYLIRGRRDATHGIVSDINEIED